MNKFLILILTLLTLSITNILAHEAPVANSTGKLYYDQARFKKDEINKPFYYIRHGQTDINKYGKVLGDTNVPLNNEGISQVENAAKILKDKGIKIIVASPLIRTKQTAKIINKELNVPIVYHDGLKEGNWGIKKGEDLKKASEHKKIWLKGGYVPGAESLYHLQTRVHKTIIEIVNKYDNVLIVGHAGYFGNLVLLLNGEYIKTKNAVPVYFSPISGNDSKELYNINYLDK